MESRLKKSNSKSKRQSNEEQNAYSAKSAGDDENEKTKNPSSITKSLEKVSSGILRNESPGKSNENLNEQAKGDCGGKPEFNIQNSNYL